MCQTKFISEMIQEKSKMLPMEISNHRLFINKQSELKSDELTSAPVVVSLNIENLKVSLQTTTVYLKK